MFRIFSIFYGRINITWWVFYQIAVHLINYKNKNRVHQYRPRHSLQDLLFIRLQLHEPSRTEDINKQMSSYERDGANRRYGI